MPESSDPLLRPRRFYKAVTVEPAEGGWAVRLDARTPRSPRGKPLVFPRQGLAELVSAEWAAQGETVDLPTMIATRLAYTALDGVADKREVTAEDAARYILTDLVCYFADAPAALVARQEAAWGPLIAWAEEALGVRLVRATGIIHEDQPAEGEARVRTLALAYDDFGLAALSLAVGLFGSAVIALALARGRLTGDEAFAAARVDEIFQEEQWGIDAEAAARTARMAAEARMLDRWFAALR